jgi:phosphoglycerate dehydrogenase-like enzyme
VLINVGRGPLVDTDALTEVFRVGPAITLYCFYLSSILFPPHTCVLQMNQFRLGRKALRDGTIAMAGLDVFEPEPLPRDHPLNAMDQVIMTPHRGSATAQVRLCR